jgi:asparagine synthase (glutamine-hydrolysing)
MLATQHAEREIRLDDYLPRMAWAVSQIEEPLAHPGMLLQADLAQLARQQVKVVLTGQGADEPLGGYPRHQAARLATLLARPLGGVARLALTAGGTRRESGDRLLRALGARNGLERTAALFSPGAPADLDGLVRGLARGEGERAIQDAIDPWWRKSEGMDDVARILYVDVRTSLSDDLLLVGDKMAMAHGLEARVPFLDLEYLHFVESIPGSVRVHAMGDRKWLQRELARKILPGDLARSLAGSTSPFRKKRGFDVPVRDWLRRGGGTGLIEFLAGRQSRLPDLVDLAWIRQTTENYLGGRDESYRTILSLYMLELWLQAGRGGQPPLHARVA